MRRGEPRGPPRGRYRSHLAIRRRNVSAPETLRLERRNEIEVSHDDFAPQSAHPPDLFDRPEPVNLTTVIDRLNSRYGRGTISYGSSVRGQGASSAEARLRG